MTSHRIRWTDHVLSPYELAHVPPGCCAVTDPALARERVHDVLRETDLPARHAHRYAALWEACLRHGMQPSGLVVACLRALAQDAGFTTNTVARRWSAWCVQHHLWVRVPGRLYYRHPRTHNPHLGQRSRAYLVIAPDQQPEWES